MKTESPTSRLGRGLMVTLASAFMLGMTLTTDGFAQDSPADGPAIFTDKTAAWANAIQILGWQLNPWTEYELIVIYPDGSAWPGGTIVTDEDGDFLGDRYGDGTGAPLAYQVGEMAGVYEVRAYEGAWSGDLGQLPVASTTFWHNNLGS